MWYEHVYECYHLRALYLQGEAPDQESRGREGSRRCVRSSNIQNVVKDLRKEVAMETAENVANVWLWDLLSKIPSEKRSFIYSFSMACFTNVNYETMFQLYTIYTYTFKCCYFLNI